MQRLFPTALFRGQWKVLSDYRSTQPKPNWIERLIVFGVPVLVFFLMFANGGTLQGPEALLAGAALLAGTLLAAFAQLSAWRDRLTDRAASNAASEGIDRDALDETATHILSASYVAAMTAAALILGMNFSSNAAGVVHGFFAWFAASSGTFVFINFFIALPRLYANYLTMNRVRRELSGASHG